MNLDLGGIVPVGQVAQQPDSTPILGKFAILLLTKVLSVTKRANAR